MPLKVIAADLANQTLKANRFASWPRSDGPDNRVGPIARPDFTPSFQIASGDPIFTIGSCFARNIENALLARGFTLPARKVIDTDPDFAAIGPNVLNNYGVPSIYNELKWALSDRRPPVPECLFQMSGDKYVDIHLNHSLRPASLEIVTTRRKAILSAYQQIASCRVLVLTLGLAECWFDNTTSTYINTAPRRQMVREWPRRFDLHVLDYAETSALMHKSVRLITSVAPLIRIILTISPVPLSSTYRPQDVMQANTYSKSLLRTVAEEMVEAYECVDYYPSFESVSLSDRTVTWEADQIHIKKDVIDLNVSRMISKYVVSDMAEKSDLELEHLLRDAAPGRIVERLAGKGGLTPGLSLLLGEAAMDLRRADMAERAIVAVPPGFETVRLGWLRMKIAFARRDFAGTVALARAQPDQTRKRLLYWMLLVQSLGETNDGVGCMEAVETWSALKPHSGEPFRHGAIAMGKTKDYNKADYLFRKAFAIIGENDPSLRLAYAEYLAERGRMAQARSAVANLVAENAGQQKRLDELALKLGSHNLSY